MQATARGTQTGQNHCRSLFVVAETWAMTSCSWPAPTTTEVTGQMSWPNTHQESPPAAAAC